MTFYVDLATPEGKDAIAHRFDIAIIGGGAVGLTLVRELSGKGMSIALIESGGLKETPQIEELNAVEVSESLQGSAFQKARGDWHGPQTKLWTSNRQPYGVRCRVLGGSTTAWAGKIAPFDPVDYKQRPWVSDSGWPFGPEEMTPYLARAARYLDLGPLVQGASFWKAASRQAPIELSRLQHFGAFFWQVARSRYDSTDVVRFGPDFLRENHDGVTVVLNATAASVKLHEGSASDIRVLSSFDGQDCGLVKANRVILAAGAIENARLLLLSHDPADSSPVNAPFGQNAIGRYLIDHPSIKVGEFSLEGRDNAATILGFYPMQQNYQAYMYICGLALRPETQQEGRFPNMAAFTTLTLSNDDPLRALKRLLKRQNRSRLTDLITVVRNCRFVITSVGRKLVFNPRIPQFLQRYIADIAVLLNANMVAREYIGGGRGRQLERVTLSVISEQFPDPRNRIILSQNTDRLGLRLARIHWEIPTSLRQDILKFSHLLKGDLERAGIMGFRLTPELESGDISELFIHDMAHTSGTTRMGTDPTTSVVDPFLQVHGADRLYVAGASVFPTSGHANPTLVIMALAIRLADKIKQEVIN